MGINPNSPVAHDTPLASGEHNALGLAATSQREAGQSRAIGKRRDAGLSISELYAPTPRRFNDDPGTSDDDTDVADWADMEAKLTIVWVSNKIYKEKRREWILQKARTAVADHEQKFGMTFAQAEKEDILVATAKCLAEQCAKAALTKANSRASTPTGHTYVEVARTSTGVMPVDYSQSQGTPRNDPKEVHFEAEMAHHTRNQSVTRDATQSTQPISSEIDMAWDRRHNLTVRRAGEIALFGYSRIPEQGILFEDGTPIDEWKYPNDGMRVRGMSSNAARNAQGGSGGSTPPPVPAKDNLIQDRSHVSATTRSTFRTPAHTGFVTTQRGGPYANRPTMAPSEHTTQTEMRAEAPDRNYDRGISPLQLPTLERASHGYEMPTRRTSRGYEMPSMTGQPDNLMRLRGIHEAKENHRMNMKDRLSKIIDDTLGNELPLPDGYKPSYKGDRGDPRKYGRSAKMVDLEEWLSATTNRFALQRLGGPRPEIDKIRVMLL